MKLSDVGPPTPSLETVRYTEVITPSDLIDLEPGVRVDELDGPGRFDEFAGFAAVGLGQKYVEDLTANTPDEQHGADIKPEDFADDLWHPGASYIQKVRELQSVGEDDKFSIIVLVPYTPNEHFWTKDSEGEPFGFSFAAVRTKPGVENTHTVVRSTVWLTDTGHLDRPRAKLSHQVGKVETDITGDKSLADRIYTWNHTKRKARR